MLMEGVILFLNTTKFLDCVTGVIITQLMETKINWLLLFALVTDGTISVAMEQTAGAILVIGPARQKSRIVVVGVALNISL